MQQIETKQLLLRTIKPGDEKALIRLWTDPDVTRFMGGPRKESSLRPDLAEDIENPDQYTYNLWPVVQKETSRVIGHCGLLDKKIEIKTDIELIYVFLADAWGQGFATEIALALKEYAKEKMNLKRLVSIIEAENTPSIRVAEKVGMKIEKEIHRPDGKTKGLYSMAL